MDSGSEVSSDGKSHRVWILHSKDTALTTGRGRVYQFFWGSFCDWYLEIIKLRLDFSETADKAKTKAALTTLVQVFEAALRLLSPFMPFLTEELWHAIHDGNPPAKSIALAIYPRRS